MYEIIDNQILDLVSEIGLSLKEVYNLEIKTGQKWIVKKRKERTDLNILNNIEMYSAHGVDVRKIQFYNDFLNQKQDDRYKELEKRFDNKKKKVRDLDPVIDKFLVGKRIDKQWQKK